jgi:predicted nucleotidyltransferase
MRLTEQQVDSIRSLLYKADPNGKIYLFGSQVDDTRRGGDIDLFFETSIKIAYRTQLLLQYRLGVECDTNVDLLVKEPGDLEQPFFSIARKGILL